MTISIGFIPNKNTVIQMQDSEGTFQGIELTQDIMTKIRRVNNHAVCGTIGSPNLANEVLDEIVGQNFDSAKKLRTALEGAYHGVREVKFLNGVLRKYGIGNIADVTAPNPQKPLDQSVRERVLRALESPEGFGVQLMLCSLYGQPEIYTVNYPGDGYLTEGSKTYTVAGSGSVKSLDVVGTALEDFRWQKELGLKEALYVLLKGAVASQKHIGVGGPFHLKYVSQDGKGNPSITDLDSLKFNMALYALENHARDRVVNGCLDRVLNEKVGPKEMASFLKGKMHFGMEFDSYFDLKR